MNAAVWLGTVVFYTLGVSPACFSNDMGTLLRVGVGDTYTANLIEEVIMARYYHLMLACGVIALLHLLCEWLYLGRPRRKFVFLLLSGLFVVTLVGSNALQPTLLKFNKQHYTATQPADRQAAAKSFHILRAMERVFNVLMVCGLVVYLWRVANPSDNLRFVRPVQFRG